MAWLIVKTNGQAIASSQVKVECRVVLPTAITRLIQISSYPAVIGAIYLSLVQEPIVRRAQGTFVLRIIHAGLSSPPLS